MLGQALTSVTHGPVRAPLVSSAPQVRRPSGAVSQPIGQASLAVAVCFTQKAQTMHKFVAGLCLIFALSSASGRDADPCAQADNTIEVMQCLDKVYKSKDAELNAAYQALLKKLSPTMAGDTTNYAQVKSELAEGQRAWVKFRDSDCSAKYKYSEQGSMRGIVYATCRIEHTQQRTAQLIKWAGP